MSKRYPVIDSAKMNAQTLKGKAIHRLHCDPVANRVLRSQETWQLISSAATASRKIYNDEAKSENQTDTEPGVTVSPKGNVKAFSVYATRVNNKRVLIVAVRGTVTMADWFVNFNGAPKRCRQVCLQLNN